MVFLAPEVAGGVVVAYLADGRLQLPKGTPVFDIGDEETTNAPGVPPPTPRRVLPISTPPTASPAPPTGTQP